METWLVGTDFVFPGSQAIERILAFLASRGCQCLRGSLEVNNCAWQRYVVTRTLGPGCNLPEYPCCSSRIDEPVQVLQIFFREFYMPAARAAAGGHIPFIKPPGLHQILFTHVQVWAIAHTVIEENQFLFSNSLVGPVDAHPSSYNPAI